MQYYYPTRHKAFQIDGFHQWLSIFCSSIEEVLGYLLKKIPETCAAPIMNGMRVRRPLLVVKEKEILTSRISSRLKSRYQHNLPMCIVPHGFKSHPLNHSGVVSHLFHSGHGEMFN